jgi:SAM-dependent methyltransferase
MLLKLLVTLKNLLKRAGLLANAKRVAGYWLSPTTSPLPSQWTYRLRTLLEQATYADCDHIHDLPPIFHYWSNKHIRPVLNANGFEDVDDFFLKYLLRTLRSDASTPRRFASVGSGNCDLEVRLAKRLCDSSFNNFSIVCVDFNAETLKRGEALAREAGVARHIVPLQVDFNLWSPSEKFDCIMANQSLHHVVNLEALFDNIRRGLTPDGWFVVSDMIGRNAHLRWPEATAIINEYWANLPPEKQFNHMTRQREATFKDIAPNIANFEGVRAQDILPLLVMRFQFEFFFGFSNVIAPFVDRTFGPNFDPAVPADTALIDAIHARDVAGMREGRITPTQMLAAMSVTTPASRAFVNDLAPTQAIRHSQRLGPSEAPLSVTAGEPARRA